MGLFYIHHRWLNFVRKGDHLKILVAVFVLSMFVFRLGNVFLNEVSLWVTQLSKQLGTDEMEAFQFILALSFIAMTAIKVCIDSAPLHYEPYRLWSVNKRSLAIQYILLSHLKPANFFWLFSEVVMLIKAAAFGLEILPAFLAFWLMQHYLNLVLNRYRKLKWIIGGVLLILTGVLYQGWFGAAWVNPFLQLAPFSGIVALACLILAVRFVSNQPEAFMRRSRLSPKLFSLGTGELADPLFDLELKLIWRNKGTRTNLIAGALSIPVLIYYFSNAGVPAGVYFMAIITTGLVLLQHGIYTMSWEGNYFDMLVTRFTTEQFMHFKFKFYFWATSFGLVFSSLALFVATPQWLPLLAAFCYNISWNVYVVLFGVLGNKRKFALGQSILFKAESMTANVLTVSFATIILPMMLLGLLNVFLEGEGAYYGVIGISVTGLLLKDKMLRLLAKRLDQRKYQLSMAFHN